MSFLDDLPSFDHLAPVKTERCTLHGVNVHSDKPLTLIVRNASGIDAWANAVRKISARLVGIEPTARQSFDAYVRPFAEILVAGWEDANDKSGKPEPYTADKLVALLKRIAEKNLRVAQSPIIWATDDSNFLAIAPSDVDELGKP